MKGQSATESPASDATPRQSRWWFGAGLLLAVALAYLAQSLFDVNWNEGDGIPLKLRSVAQWKISSRLLLGSCLYLVALFIWTAALPKAEREPSAEKKPGTASARPRLRQPWRLRLLCGSVLSCLASMGLFAVSGETVWVVVLWVLGPCLLVVSQLAWLGDSRPGDAGESSPPFRWRHVVVLAALLAAGFWLRVDRLATLPDNLHGDMASYGLFAREYVTGHGRGFVGGGEMAIPKVGFLPTIASMKLFGDDIFGLQMAAALAGTISLLAVYLLVWRLLDRHALAAIVTGIVAGNVAHLHFSRIAAYMDPWPFSILALFFLVDGLKARRSISFALAGVGMGLAFQMYYSGRVIVFIAGALVFHAFLFRRRWIRENIAGLGVMTLGVLATFGPNIVVYWRRPDAFLARTRGVFIFDPGILKHSMNKFGVSSTAGVLGEQLRLSLLMLNRSADSSTQFGWAHPMFSSWISPLIVLGLGCCLRSWRRPWAGLTLWWLALMIVLGSVLTVDAPFWPRLVGIVPPAALLAGLTLETLWEWATSRGGRPGHVVFGGLVAALVIAVGWRGFRLYEATLRNNAWPKPMLGRFLTTLPSHVAVCNLSDIEVRDAEVLFLAGSRRPWQDYSGKPVEVSRTIVNVRGEPPPGCLTPPFVWILPARDEKRLQELRAAWPGGTHREHRSGGGDLIFESYFVASPPSGNS